jgi:hypothetical protein
MMDNVALGQVFSPSLSLCIIPPVLHVHSCMIDTVILATDSVNKYVTQDSCLLLIINRSMYVITFGLLSVESKIGMAHVLLKEAVAQNLG